VAEINDFESFTTLKDYETNVKAAQTAFDNAEANQTRARTAFNSGARTFQFDGETLDLTGIRDLLPSLAEEKSKAEKALSKAKEVFKVTKEKQKNPLRSATKALSIAEDNLKTVQDQFRRGIATEKKVRDAAAKIQTITTDISRINNGEIAFAGANFTYGFQSEVGKVEGATIPTTETQDIAAQKKANVLKSQEEKEPTVTKTEKLVVNGSPIIRYSYSDNSTKDVADTGQKPAVVGTTKSNLTVQTGGTTTPETTVVTDANARKEFVDAELVKRKLEDTPENRATLRKEYATLPSVVSTDWESAFRAIDPSKAWLLDEDRTKYPELFALLQKAHDEKYYDTPEGQARFQAELKGVDFYKEIATSGKVREIKKIVGDLGFDSTDFSKFVADSINRGWTGDTLKAETYKEVFRRTPDGTYANPTAVKRATQGNDYLNMQLIAKNYFNEAPQSTIENILTGGITVDDFQRQQRVMAKQRYGHLSELIDQGVTLEDLASNYRQSAAKLLEIDPNQIDMSQGDYEVALSFGEEGKKRAMTTGEWEKLLRTDARYGWEKTENAKSEARSLASNIAEAFGRII
jgi:hypothetical protein